MEQAEKGNGMDGEERLKRQQEFLVKVAYWAVWGTAGVLLIKFVGPVLLPFILAFLLALALRRPVDDFSERLHLNRSVAAIAAVLLVYVAAGVLLYLLGNKIVGLIQSVFGDLTRFFSETLFPMIQNFCAWMDRVMSGTIQETAVVLAAQEGTNQVLVSASRMVSGVTDKVIDGVSGFAAGIPQFCMNVLLMVIATVFMEVELPGILQFLRRQVPKRWQNTLQEIKSHTTGTFGRFVLAYLMILTLTFAELFIGFLILGIDGAFALAFVVAVLDILPVIGTGTVLLPWTVIAFASGNLRMGIGVLILYLVITVVRNIMEPKLVGQQMGLSPVVMLPGMILGLHFFGIIGMFGVPFLIAFLKSLNDRGVIHIFKTE